MSDLAASEADPIIERVRAIIAAECGVFPVQVLARSRLGEDLGIDGDDATELFEAFGREFGLDFSDMRWNCHFGPEAGWNPLISPFLPALLPVSVADVAAAARVGRWVYHYPDDSDEGRTPNPSLERTGQGRGVWSRLRRLFRP